MISTSGTTKMIVVDVILVLSVLLLSSPLCAVHAESPDWNNILTVGAGPTYNKYFGKAQPQKPATVKKTKTKKPSPPSPPPPPPKAKSKDGKDVNPYGPMPELPTPMIKDGLLGMVEDGMGMNEDVIKAGVGIVLGLMAVPLIGSGRGKDKKKVLPPPPPPPKQIMPVAVPTATKPKKKSMADATSGVTINLIKNIIGLSVLSLPSGIAAYGSTKDAIVPGLVLIGAVGILSGYGFCLIGKVCELTSAKTYKDAWSKTVGKSSSIIPTLFIICQTTLTLLAISLILRDTFTTLFDIENATAGLIGVTLFALLPLSLQSKDMNSLTKYSFVGILGVLFTGITMAVRLFDGNYVMPVLDAAAKKSGLSSAQLSGFLAEIPKFSRPSFGKLGMDNILTSNSMILISMLSTAFMSHFNAPKFYTELTDTKTGSGSFNSMVQTGFGISIVIMAIITTLGYLTFGRNCDGLILNNYSTSDTLINSSRAAMAISLIVSYPLIFTGLRDAVMDLFNVSNEDRVMDTAKVNSITSTLVAVLTMSATVLGDVGDLTSILTITGAIMGSALTFIFPPMMYKSVVKQGGSKGEGLGVMFASITSLVGVLMAAVGITVAVSSLSE